MNQFFKPITTSLPLALALTLLAGARSLADDATAAAKDFTHETPAQRDARLKWWSDARFGMFIHWGLYSQAAGYWDGKPTKGAGEWIMNDMQIPDSQYAKLVPQFNPVKFNAREWVRIAKNAGMKYIVITSKHHDGFGLFRSDLTDWCIKSTPFQRDPLMELSKACRAEGVRLCFYHSIMDWHHPDYVPRKPWNDLASPNPNFDNYVAYLKGELKELLTRYGPVGILWFDGEWENSWTPERGDDLYNYVRGLQPNIIVNNRVGKERKGMAGMNQNETRAGDYGTPEQTIPATGFGPGVYWESCMTMNDTWGYKRDDNHWKSSQTLVRNLIDCASKGGNYLLNVGPTGEGLIPGASVERLREVGAWMKYNHEAIYDTSASPFKKLSWGRCTKKVTPGGATLYLHVFDWPADGKLFVPGLKNNVAQAYLLKPEYLGWHQPLKAANDDGGVTISVPASAPDKFSSTIVLKINGEPDVTKVLAAQQADGSMRLLASDADLHGELQYETGDGKDNIGYWTNPEDTASWTFKMNRPGKFKVVTDIAAEGSGKYEISVGSQKISGTAPNTGSYTKFETTTLSGVLELPPGAVAVTVKPVPDGWQPMNLRSLTLQPAN
jgi:alpha-L-fucosidase